MGNKQDEIYSVNYEFEEYDPMHALRDPPFKEPKPKFENDPRDLDCIEIRELEKPDLSPIFPITDQIPTDVFDRGLDDPLKLFYYLSNFNEFEEYDPMQALRDPPFKEPEPKFENDSRDLDCIEIPNLEKSDLSPIFPITYQALTDVSEKKKVCFEVRKKKLSGRKRQRKENIYYKTHSKESSDNVIRKINVGYLQFTISFFNSVINFLNFGISKEYEFKKLNYETIRVINKKTFLNNMSKTIGQLIKEIPISSKYKESKDPEKKNCNQKLVDYFSEKSEIMKNIFNENFLSLFPIYYKNERKVNLSKFGKNEFLILSNNVKLYEDLLKKGDNSKEDYKKICENTIKNWFLSK